jgi:hypothetical protein
LKVRPNNRYPTIVDHTLLASHAIFDAKYSLYFPYWHTFPQAGPN